MTSNYYNPTDPNLIYIQSRAETDPALIEEYAEAMAAGAQFPALKAIGEQHTLYIYDGYHRGQAAQKTGLPLCISVKPGTRAEAEWLALAANQEHGLRRSNADKQKIVRLALAHDFGAKLSDRQLAAHCGVSHPTVARIREEMEATGKIYQSATRIGADGREINVGNIGSSLSIVQLESKVRDWLRQKGDAPIGFLEEIKQRTDDGKALFAALGDSIAEKYRPGDLWQACNNTLDQLKQRQWRAERAQRIRAMTCLCGQQALEPVGERDGLMCTSCGRVWNCVADFENACQGCGRDLRNTLRVEGEQYCADCWEKKKGTAENSPIGEKAEREKSVMCPNCDEVIFPDQDTKPNGAIVCDACKKRFASYEALMKAAERMEDYEGREEWSAAPSPTGPKPLLCHRCGNGRVVKKPGDSGLICLGCNFKWNNLADFRSGRRHHLENNRPPLLKHLELKVKGFPQTCPTGHANPVNGGNCMGCQFHRQTDHGHWVCYHPTHQEPTQTEDATAELLRKELAIALQGNDDERWDKHRQTGLSNADLVAELGRISPLGGSWSGWGDSPGAGYKGGKEPKFWLGNGWPYAKPTLAGAALRDAARELLGIPFPGDVADGEGEYDFTGLSTADLEAGLGAIERDGLPLDSPHARRLREELATRKNGAAPDPWQPSTPGLARDLNYRHQRLCMRFAGMVEKIKDIAWMDELDRRLGELEAEIAGDPAKISEATR